jgi:GNAT superfamily N-acetyltransferase
MSVTAHRPPPTQPVRFGRDTFVLRPLRRDDAHRLQDFFYSHNADTIWFRYGHAVGQMTEQRASALVGVDQIRDVALGVFEPLPAGDILHAVGRYYLDADRNGAEVAFVVRESLRRRGIGSHLLATLIEVARARGVKFLWGRVHRSNLAMLAVFRAYGGRVLPSDDPEDHDLRVQIDLAAKPTPRGRRRNSTPQR